jgi:orotate phosphoribosyltransferase
MLNPEEVLEIYRESNALLEGHFKLRSGLHSSIFLQSAAVFQYPGYATRICSSLAAKITTEKEVDLVIGPAIGGVITAHEVAKAMNARAIFGEKDGKGGMFLRPGFEIKQGENIVIVDDVLTRGTSVAKLIKLVDANQGNILTSAFIIDRSQGKQIFDLPKVSLVEIEVENYHPEECPMCKAGENLIEP